MTAQRFVSIIGSGNWGSTIGKIVALNVSKMAEFNDEVKMWVFEESINGKPLSVIINEKHENVKYLAGIKLPTNLKAVPDLVECVKNSDVLLFVIPHQFLKKTCQTIKAHLKTGAYGCSLIKGLAETPGAGISLLSDLISDELGIHCACLMGANLAKEVAVEMFCEATIASSNIEHGRELKSIFQTPYFRISVIRDVAGAELCGALKNIVAIGAGLIDGLEYGDNTKAAAIRLGFMEIKKFIYEFFADRDPQESTFLESCGVADLITSCYGGRNRKIGFALATSNKSVKELEEELLEGQSAQGVLTASEVNTMLSSRNIEFQFPIFTAIHNICRRTVSPSAFIDSLRDLSNHQTSVIF